MYEHGRLPHPSSPRHPMSEVQESSRRDARGLDLQNLPPVEDVPEQMVPPSTTQWTYQRLATTFVIREHCAKLAASIRRVYSPSSQPPRICLLIDNSGSMAHFHKPVHITEAIVIFCETMKLVELPFAVAKFGSKQASKLILKNFDRSFSFLQGQQILESLTYDEATATATALHRIPPCVWKQEEKHRELLMITDGITPEIATALYTSPIEVEKFSLSVLHLSEGCSQESPLATVFNLPEISHYPVERNELLPENLSQSLQAIFHRHVQNTTPQVSHDRTVTFASQGVESFCLLVLWYETY